jgi:hypothetical protein
MSTQSHMTAINDGVSEFDDQRGVDQYLCALGG